MLPGIFSSARTALEFVSKYQREDGKIPHEISQGANFVDWFKGYPYPYASADATPLYIMAMNDYVVEAATPHLPKKNGTVCGKPTSFCARPMTSKAFPRMPESGTAGWKAVRCFQ